MGKGRGVLGNACMGDLERVLVVEDEVGVVCRGVEREAFLAIMGDCRRC